MKKLFFSSGIAALLLINMSCFAQAPPEGINYQAVARNNSGQVISNKQIKVQFSIMDAPINGSMIFREQHTDTTNKYGLFTSKIGMGTNQTGVLFSAIPWAVGNKYLEVAIDTGSGSYNIISTIQMMSVPYALYAKTSGTALTGTPGAIGATGVTGANGMTGSTGTTGAFGATGAIGATGADGALNAWSLTGNTGTNAFTNYIGTADPQDLVIKTNGIEKMRVQTGGNVGIGTAAPHSKFEVVDTSVNSFSGIIGTQYNSSPFADSHIWLRKARGTESAPLHVQAGDEIGSLKFRGYNGTAFSTNDLTEIVAVASDTANGSFLKFMTTPNGTQNGAERMRIDQNGAVGIGTANPGAMLEVAGQVKITGGSPAAGRVLTSDALGFAAWAPLPPSSSYIAGTGLTLSGTTFNSVWTASGADIYNNNTGNVGIGTAVPQSLLHIYANNSTAYSPVTQTLAQVSITNIDQTNTSFSRLLFNTNDANGALATGASLTALFTSHVASAVSADLIVQTKQTGINSEVARFSSSGNVGIGTTVPPTAKLEVAGTIKITGDSTKKLIRTQTGSANLVPIAYGSINSDGTLNASTGNLIYTVSGLTFWDSGSNTYKINISSENYTASGYITIVTAVGGAGVKIETSSSGGFLIVTIYSHPGTQTQNAFHFITYKP